MSSAVPPIPARMLLSEALRSVNVRAQSGPDVAVGKVTADSRQVEPGDLFVAIRGRSVDGHAFLQSVAEAGAAAVVVSQDVTFPGTVVRVDDTAEALGQIAANRVGRPGDAMVLVGLTGTNGKTTTTYLLESILRVAGKRPGVVGTVSYRFAGRERPAPYTTPTAPELQALLAEMRGEGVSHVVMEVSSHALEQRRVAGLRFAAAGFTNLTQDHLDLHGTMEAYEAAKRRLFETHLRPEGTAVLWADDPAAERMAAASRGRVLRVSAQRPDADVSVTLQAHSLDGLRARLRVGDETVLCRSPLVGEHNLANAALAAGIAHALGIGVETIARGIQLLKVVPGRLERVPGEADDPAVLVDYAHTPDALAHALDTLRPLTPGRLLCVFGCGGDRDTLKRPLMGRAVAERADVTVVTSDNPRTEDPLAIIAEILDGVSAVGRRRVSPDGLTGERGVFTVVPDRRAAIRTAVGQAGPEDVVLIAGKGHEDYQILGRERIHFDDREEARAALADRRGA